MAAELDFTRSTASALVAELAERGLVHTGTTVRGAVGRPGTSVELDGHNLAGIGAEINVNHIATRALDLSGRVLSEHKYSLNAGERHPEEVLDHLAVLVALTLADLDGYGAAPVGLTVGIAGLVDLERELVTHAPNLGWRDLSLGEALRARLDTGLEVAIENEGSLAALAETHPGSRDDQDLLVLFGEVGVGGGIVAAGDLLRGRRGFAGEFAHMIVEPRGRRCGCGRVGCWETLIGLRALLALAAPFDDPIQNPELSIEVRLADLQRRADHGDPLALGALKHVGYWIGVGAATLVNIMNPAASVLSGTYASLAEHLIPSIQKALRDGVLAPDAGGSRVYASALGLAAAAHGGAQRVLNQIFHDPTVVPTDAASTVAHIGRRSPVSTH